MKKQLGPFSFVIDRPKGTVKEWPQPDGSVKRFVYPCDYGYWPKIKGEDGEGLDAFVGDDPKGHKESFQKLNPDGTPDETKFLLGVTDRQREAIYGLYKTEVNARRVYDDWDDVQAALDEYKGKMHKTAASTEQVARAKALLEDPAFVWHGTNSPSDGASTGKIRYGGGLDALGKGVYLGAKPQMEYWNGAGYAVPRAHLSRDHIDLSSFGNRWQVDPKDVPLRDGAVAFVHPSLYEEAKTRFGSHGVDVLPLDALHEARGGKLPNQPIGGFGPETPAKQQSTQSKVNDYLPAGLIALQTAASALRDYKINTEDAGVLPYRRDAYRISPATVGTVAGGALGYGLGKLFRNVNPLRHISGLRAPAHSAMVGSVLGATLGARSDDNLERSHVFRQLENAHAARSRGENEKLRTTKSKLTDEHNLRGTANAALTGHDPDRNVIVADAQALAKSLKDPTRDVGFFASRSAPIDKKYRDWVRSGREMGKDRGLYVGKREIKSAEHSHRWSYGYLPGTGYRHCACGEIEEVFPDGPAKPMAEKEKGFVRRHLEKSAAFLFGERLADSPGELFKFAATAWQRKLRTGTPEEQAQIRARLPSNLIRFAGIVDEATLRAHDFRGIPSGNRDPGPVRPGMWLRPEELGTYRRHMLQYPSGYRTLDGPYVFPNAGMPERLAVPRNAVYRLGPDERDVVRKYFTERPWIQRSKLPDAPIVLRPDTVTEAQNKFPVVPLLVGGAALLAGAYGLHRAFAKRDDDGSDKTAAFRFGEKLADSPGDLSGLIGGHDYYMARALDFRRRHPDQRAPDYYTDYGDKYVHRYSNELAPKLSPIGKKWVDDTRSRLQSAIEDKRREDPEAFDRMEQDPDAFREFAFGTHPDAYLKSGLKRLPFKDKARVAVTPDLRDLIRPSGIRQAARTLGGLVSEKTAMDPFASMNWVPSSFAGRVQSPGQIMQASQVTPALAGTQENIRMLQLAQDPFTGAMPGSPTPGASHHRHRRHHR